MHIIRGKQKAWGAALVGTLAAFGMQRLAGADLDPTAGQELATLTGEIVASLVFGAIQYAGVYMAPKNQ